MHRRFAVFAALLAVAFAGATATSVLAQGATPVAQGEVVDPGECRVEPRSEESERRLAATSRPGGTPTGGTVAGSPTAFALPEGEPADQATVDGATATYREQIACLNAGDYRRVYALYTDNYFQRFLEQETLDDLAATPVPSEKSTRIAFLVARNVVALPDGRVGALADVASPAAGGTATTYAVVARVGGRWLIDEATLVEAPESGTPAAGRPAA